LLRYPKPSEGHESPKKVRMARIALSKIASTRFVLKPSKNGSITFAKSAISKF